MAQESDQPETGGTGLGHRSVTMTRTEKGTYLVTNVRGGFGGARDQTGRIVIPGWRDAGLPVESGPAKA